MHDAASISLIGMPGSGKSTVGVLLAKSLNKQFIDTDLFIQQRCGSTLQDYLERYGVDQLRRVEEETILALELKDAVVATGGSAIYGLAAMKHLKGHSRIIFLDVSFELMITRIGDYSARGIAKDPGLTLEDMYDERLQYYRKYAEATVRADSSTEAVRAMIEDLTR